MEAADGRGLTLALDVTDSASVAAGVARTADELGAVDILVNNAGWDELRPVVETDEALWDRVIDINYKGVGARRVHHGPDVVGQRRADDGLSRADAATPR